MIATRFCDICDVELPPMAFVNRYECADVDLHENHPDKKWSWIRITASPDFTNGDCTRRPDVCPECFLALCESLVKRVKSRNKRNASALDKWKHARETSKKKDIVRNGANEQAKTP